MSSSAAESRSAAHARVLCLVAAARALVEGRSHLVGPIAEETGLSPEGVELALTEHLETDPDPRDVARLLDRAAPADAVTVVLSANAFVGALRAVALALASTSRVFVKASRREHRFVRALLDRAPELGVGFGLSLDVPGVREGEIHVYGRDETIAAVRAASKVPVRGHGAGFGVVEVAGDDPDGAARAIVRDVVPFDQRGCLSPRVVLVHGGPERAHALARALHRALGAREMETPRGALSDEERAAAVRYRDTMTVVGEAWEGAGHLVGASTGFVLPPAGRCVHVAPFDAASKGAVEASARFVTALGTDAAESGLVLPHARISALGGMQRPPLDGPVDQRPD